MSLPVEQQFWRKPLDSGEIDRLRGVVHIIEDRCKGCAYCVEFCPRDVLALSDHFNLKGYHPPEVVCAEACTACHLCEILCPDFAISIEEQTFKEATHGG